MHRCDVMVSDGATSQIRRPVGVRHAQRPLLPPRPCRRHDVVERAACPTPPRRCRFGVRLTDGRLRPK